MELEQGAVKSNPSLERVRHNERLLDSIYFDWYDYGDFPIGAAEVALVSRELHVNLGDWASDAGANFFRDDESAARKEWIILWTDRGRSLARAVSEELGRPVSYHNQQTGEIEEINFPPPPPTGRRHHRPRGN